MDFIESEGKMHSNDYVGYFQTKDLELMLLVFLDVLLFQLKSDRIAPGDDGGIMALVPIFNDETWLFRAVLAQCLIEICGFQDEWLKAYGFPSYAPQLYVVYVVCLSSISCPLSGCVEWPSATWD